MQINVKRAHRISPLAFQRSPYTFTTAWAYYYTPRCTKATPGPGLDTGSARLSLQYRKSHHSGNWSLLWFEVSVFLISEGLKYLTLSDELKPISDEPTGWMVCRHAQ